MTMNEELLRKLETYLAENYIEPIDAMPVLYNAAPSIMGAPKKRKGSSLKNAVLSIKEKTSGLFDNNVLSEDKEDSRPGGSGGGHSFAVDSTVDLEDALKNLDESFSDYLLRLIDAKGMKDSECYNRACVDRRLFSKIRSNPDYHPAKETVLSFALALELNLSETQDLLRRAGFTLSHSNKADVIMEFCIQNRIHDIFEVDDLLRTYDQRTLVHY